MTVNDITFRSQQMVEGARQFQDQRRDQANANIGNTVQNLGNQLVDMQRYDREFAVRQQAMQSELAMQQADAGMRLALQQQELQSNQYKLQQMAAIDAVDMSREQLRSMKLENDAREYSLEQQKKMAEPELDIRMQEAKARFISALGGARGAISFGIDPLTGRKFASTSEQEAAMQRAEQLYGSEGGVDAETLARRNITQSVGSIARLDEMILMEQDPAKKAQMQAMQDELIRRATPKGVSPSGQDGRPSSNQKEIEDLAGRMTGMVPALGEGQYYHPIDSLGNPAYQQAPALGPQQKRDFAGWILGNIDNLIRAQQIGFDSDPSRKGITATRESAIADLLAIANNPNHPRHAALMATLRAEGVIK